MPLAGRQRDPVLPGPPIQSASDKATSPDDDEGNDKRPNDRLKDRIIHVQVTVPATAASHTEAWVKTDNPSAEGGLKARVQATTMLCADAWVA